MGGLQNQAWQGEAKGGRTKVMLAEPSGEVTIFSVLLLGPPTTGNLDVTLMTDAKLGETSY